MLHCFLRYHPLTLTWSFASVGDQWVLVKYVCFVVITSWPVTLYVINMVCAVLIFCSLVAMSLQWHLTYDFWSLCIYAHGCIYMSHIASSSVFSSLYRLCTQLALDLAFAVVAASYVNARILSWMILCQDLSMHLTLTVPTSVYSWGKMLQETICDKFAYSTLVYA